jgi:two-component system cell cycle sensor histidine kinase/response regulator CckA
LHSLIKRQIKRYLKDIEPLPEGFQEFIQAVDKAYHENDEDRIMLERAFDLSSQELMGVNAEVRNALGRFESIIENTPFVAIQGFDRHGTILHWNNACEAIYGYAAHEAKGNRIQDILLSGESVADFENNLEQIWTTRKPTHPQEWEVHNRNDETRWVFSTMFPIIEGNEVVEVFCMDLDLTDRKRLESQLLQSQKMEAVGTLAGGIAHDFNNILMGIQGYASLMLSGADSSNPYYRKLKSIEALVISGANLTKQLLGFARSGRYEVKPTNLNDIIEKTAALFGRTKKEIFINRLFQTDIWTVEVDQGQIEQVLLNLYVNAWQAMPAGGNIYLETKNVIIKENEANRYSLPEGHYVNICITDTGTGMDEATRLRIFEPFFTTKEMGRGTGLGLASVYGIIKGHGGVINVYSERGHGTTFRIYLPVSDKELVKDNKPQSAIVKGHETILLVDDEDAVINVTRELIRLLGYKVIIAKRGFDAVKIFRKNHKKIDVVILDMIMPEMSGGETFDALKAVDPDVIVILSSGYSINGQASDIMKRGCRYFIQKPFSISDISAKIRAALEET